MSCATCGHRERRHQRAVLPDRTHGHTRSSIDNSRRASRKRHKPTTTALIATVAPRPPPPPQQRMPTTRRAPLPLRCPVGVQNRKHPRDHGLSPEQSCISNQRISAEIHILPRQKSPLNQRCRTHCGGVTPAPKVCGSCTQRTGPYVPTKWAAPCPPASGTSLVRQRITPSPDACSARHQRGMHRPSPSPPLPPPHFPASPEGRSHGGAGTYGQP